MMVAIRVVEGLSPVDLSGWFMVQDEMVTGRGSAALKSQNVRGILSGHGTAQIGGRGLVPCL
jgi:hypothetical protein